MEPIRETAEALEALSHEPGAEDLVADLTRLANQAQEVVPDLVGVSVARLQEELTFTLVATAEEVAVLDAVQYVAGGPCVDGAHAEDVLEFTVDDVLDEDRWQLFAGATAAHTMRSTLTLPVMRDGVIGTVNLYAASRQAFEGHHEQLAELFGAWAEGAVTNADLSFRTRELARQAPIRVRERAAIDVAVGILAVQLGVDASTATARLEDAASRAGVRPVDLAEAIVRARERRNMDDD